MFKVQKNNRDDVFITQSRNISIFPGLVKSIHGTQIFLHDKNFTLSNISFSGSGLYSDIYLKERNRYLFEPITYKSLQSGITSSINIGDKSEEQILSGNLNFLDIINYEELISVIFDVSLFSWISPFMTILGNAVHCNCSPSRMCCIRPNQKIQQDFTFFKVKLS